MNTLNLSKQDISAITLDSVAELAKRLELDAYDNVFEGLDDWHLLAGDRLSAARIGGVLYASSRSRIL